MYNVSQVAAIFQVQPQTIRDWDRKGILKPCFISPTKRRFYDEEVVNKLWREGVVDGSTKD